MTQTGKTVTIAAIAWLLKAHFQVSIPLLVCAPTHAAVDHLSLTMEKWGLKPLRIGRPERIRQDCLHFSYAYLLRSHPAYYKLEALKNIENKHATALEVLDVDVHTLRFGSPQAPLSGKADSPKIGTRSASIC